MIHMPKPRGPVIEAIRKQRSWKRSELARRVGCSYQHIYNIEKGHMPASDELLVRIARELGTSVDELMPTQDAA